MRRRGRISTWTASTTLLTVGTLASAMASTAPPDSGASLGAGRLLYNQNCARCHGFQMLNPPPGVFDLRTFPQDKERFIASVSEGKGAMPSWKGTLSAADIETLWTYVSRPAPR